MKYKVELKAKAFKDLSKLPANIQNQIISKLEILENNLQGDIKKLTNFTPEYRLRVGNYRVLFELEQDTIIIYRIKHRNQSYN